MKKKPKKDEILLEIVRQLKSLPAPQLLVMFQIIQLAGNTALQFSEAYKQAGGPVGIKMDFVRPEVSEGKPGELKS